MVYCKKYEDLLCGILRKCRKDIRRVLNKIQCEYSENVAHSNHSGQRSIQYQYKMLNTDITTFSVLKIILPFLVKSIIFALLLYKLYVLMPCAVYTFSLAVAS